MQTRVRTSVVVVHNDRLLTFHAIDPTSGREYLFLPGGAIEPEEPAPDAAERETLEETGYRVKVDPSSCIDREYLFHWDGKDYDCLTLFYLGTLRSPMAKPVQDADYNRGVHWLPLAEVDDAFAYSEPILAVVRELLSRDN